MITDRSNRISPHISDFSICHAFRSIQSQTSSQFCTPTPSAISRSVPVQSSSSNGTVTWRRPSPFVGCPQYNCAWSPAVRCYLKPLALTRTLAISCPENVRLLIYSSTSGGYCAPVVLFSGSIPNSSSSTSVGLYLISP